MTHMEKYFQGIYVLYFLCHCFYLQKISVTKRKVWVYVGGQQNYLCERMIFFMLSAMRKL